jgi:hypothetical protein
LSISDDITRFRIRQRRLVIVAVNPQGTDIEGLLTNAEIVVACTGIGDSDALDQAFETAAA